MKIKAGYRLEVVSWENDADNYNTKVIDGLDKETCQFYIDLVKLTGKNAKFGNMYEPSDKEFKEFTAALVKVFQAHGKPTEDEDEVHDEAIDIIGDMLGNSEHYHTRVMDRYKVCYLPVEVELQDVTNQFK
jgi:N-acetyl-anhydromuramyl-L-alanine amidase AmpD